MSDLQTVDRPHPIITAGFVTGIVATFLLAADLLPTRPFKPLLGDNPTRFFRWLARTTVLMHLLQATGSYLLAKRYNLNAWGWFWQAAVLGVPSVTLLLKRVMVADTPERLS